MTNASIESLYQTIATGCITTRPSDWRECVIKYDEIARFASYQLYFLVPGDNKIYEEVEDSVADAFGDLRKLMAVQSGGDAWYTATFRMKPDGVVAQMRPAASGRLA